MLFTFRRKGDNNGKRLVEIVTELIEQHEASTLEFAPRDVEGVMAPLHFNRDATREAAVLPSDLVDAGFGPST